MSRKNRTTGIPKAVALQTFTYPQVHQIVQEARLEVAHGMITDIVPLFSHAMAIELLLQQIHFATLILQGDDLKREVPTSLAGELANVMTDILMVADRTNTDTSFVHNRIITHIEAIRALHNDNDNGDALRELATEDLQGTISERVTHITHQWQQAAENVGRPKGKTAPKQWLKDRWIELEASHPECNAGEIRDLLLAKIAVRTGNSYDQWQAKPGISPIEKQALKDLLRKRASEPSKYRDDILNK